MSAADIAAIYAAAVSTVVGGIRVAEWVRDRRLRSAPPIVVEPRFGYIGDNLAEAVLLNVHNHADHALRVASAGLMLQDGSARTVQHPNVLPGATLPGPIAPHDSGMTYFYLHYLEEHDFDPHRPVAAWATLSTGETFRSENKPLLTG